ncbi:aldose 1-epimerase family protein [Bacillus sp. C1-1]|uniref:Aldose 1-epimerase family protein n=1 Tax=Shouchella lehensis TaxID=300825 RepID=A0A4Y7WKE9_9BACI|nr:aldose 1-epimerase family protein [Bacillus sp. C1-1]TES48518.1 aldose 1-epimerase family protein [Shouchella lehensis]
MIIIENDRLQVEIAHKGAEVQKVTQKTTTQNRMWSGDPAYWGRVSPILFPIVGGLKNETYSYKGKSYTLPRHGFLRDQVFVTHSLSKTKARFHFESSGQFAHVYPFEFTVYIDYELHENTLHIQWRVVNNSEEEMLFSIGGHPAFSLPMEENTNLEDHVLTLRSEKEVTSYQLTDGLLKEVEALPQSLSLVPRWFKDDALVYKGIQTVEILVKEETKLRVDLHGAPYVGIWSPYKEQDQELAFICIEPWYGIADKWDASGNLEDKEGIQRINANESFKEGYTIHF